MQESTSKEKVLKKIRNALVNKAIDAVPKDVDFDSPIYNMPDQPLEITFAERFTELTGKFIFCENEEASSKTLYNVNLEKIASNFEFCVLLKRDISSSFFLSSSNLFFQNERI
ncbi:MAG: hypothetical protein ACK4ON_03685, partial [Bacteroidia bacterium]